MADLSTPNCNCDPLFEECEHCEQISPPLASLVAADDTRGSVATVDNASTGGVFTSDFGDFIDFADDNSSFEKQNLANPVEQSTEQNNDYHNLKSLSNAEIDTLLMETFFGETEFPNTVDAQASLTNVDMQAPLNAMGMHNSFDAMGMQAPLTNMDMQNSFNIMGMQDPLSSIGMRPGINGMGMQSSIDDLGMQSFANEMNMLSNIDDLGMQSFVNEMNMQPSINDMGMQSSANNMTIQPSFQNMGFNGNFDNFDTSFMPDLNDDFGLQQPSNSDMLGFDFTQERNDLCNALHGAPSLITDGVDLGQGGTFVSAPARSVESISSPPANFRGQETDFTDKELVPNDAAATKKPSTTQLNKQPVSTLR